MSEKTVPLSRRYEAHGKAFDTVRLREPRWPDLFVLGEPQEWQAGKTGPVLLTFHDVLGQYIDRCCIEPGSEALQALGIEDARAVRDAMLGFFERRRESGKKDSNSSSPSDGAPATSTG